MPTPNNMCLLEASIAHPEPLLDAAYSKESHRMVISGNPKDPTPVQFANRGIIENITAIGVIIEREPENPIIARLISEIVDKLGSGNINYCDFVSYWNVHDISFSIYQAMSLIEKREFLRMIIPLYLKQRHPVYLSYGYSDVSLQARADSALHKSSGELGLRKVSGILSGLRFAKVTELSAFEASPWCFLLADKDGRRAADELRASRDILPGWKQGKRPDFLVKIGDRIFVVEHKHMKETGGGQDKQLDELISIVRMPSHGAPPVSYVSFLDGILFAKLFDENYGGAKMQSQRQAIREGLRNNSGNYFVNTCGFRQLMEAFIAAAAQDNPAG